MSIHELLTALIAAVIPVAFAIFIWLRRELAYVHWARIAGIVGAASGIASASLSLVASHAKALHFTRDTYLLLLASKHTLNGIFIGIVICVLLSKPWTNTHQ
jgi:hypothetical protein